MLKVDVLTLFPAALFGLLNFSILKRAQDKNLCKINIVDIRDFSTLKHKQVDDRPFGGGAGMVLMVEPIFNAIKHLNKENNAKIILTCPRGSNFTRTKAKKLSKEKHIIIICGHYEGVDERVKSYLADESFAIGDCIFTGGEIPAMAIVDATIRLLPGALGNTTSLIQKSFPQYTRPEVFKGWKVPNVLLSGDHKKINEWRERA